MNQKIKELENEYQFILKEKSVHVTKKRHFQMLIVASIFLATGFLIGYIFQLQENLSYGTNMIIVTVLGSIIIYRYASEAQFMHLNQCEYNIHLAVLPKLIKDITNIVITIVATLLIILNGYISFIIVLFYVFLMLILIIINYIISSIQYYDYNSISLSHTLVFVLYNLITLYLMMKILPIHSMSINLTVSVFILFILNYLMVILKQDQFKLLNISTILILILMGITVISSLLYVFSKDEIKREEEFSLTYDKYDFEQLYSGNIFTIESSSNRIMMVTHDFELIIFDNKYQEINRFDVSNLDATTFVLYEINDQFYMGVGDITLYTHFYSQFYMIDETEGLSIISIENWNTASFYYNDLILNLRDNPNQYINEYGNEVRLYYYLESNPDFMIEKNHILVLSDKYNGAITYLSSDVSEFNAYYNNYTVVAEYSKENVLYICDPEQFMTASFSNCSVLGDEYLRNELSSIISFQYIDDAYYFETFEYNEPDSYYKKITKVSLEGEIVEFHELYGEEYIVLLNHIVQVDNGEVLVAPLTSTSIKTMTTFEGFNQIGAIIILSLFLACGLPFEGLTFDKIKEKRI